MENKTKNRKIRIYEAFKSIGIDPHTYICCGSDGGALEDGHYYYKNPVGRYYFNYVFKDKPFPSKRPKCICNINIIENCYVTTPDFSYDNVVVIGNCCYEHFIDNKVTYCLVCNEPHTNGIKKNAGLCDNCKIVRRAKLKEISKEMTLLLKEHESSLNDIVKKQQIEYKYICSLHDQSIQKAIYYDKLRKEGKLEEYLEKEKKKELIKQSTNLLNKYKDILLFELNQLNNAYNLRFNKFEVFNRFNKLPNKNKILKCICNDTYKIACIYIDSKHVHTINLLTLRATQNSPNLITF